jgi:hypothetical protein
VRRPTSITLVASLAFSGAAVAAVHPTVAVRVEQQEDATLRVARRKNKRDPVAAEPVRVRSAKTRELSLQQKGRNTLPVYTVMPDAPMTFEVTGPGKLALVFHQLLPSASKTRRHTFLVSVDGKPPAKVKVTNKPYRRASVTGDVTAVSVGKRRIERIRGGPHTVEIQAPAGCPGAVLRVEMYPTGARAAAPVLVEAAGPEPAAAVADAREEPLAIPTPPVAAERPANPDREPPLAAAAPKAKKPVEKGALPDDPVAILAARLRSGEVRDGLVGSYDTVTLVRADSGDRTDFQRIGAEQSYTFMVQGPGEVTVYLHRLVAPESVAAIEGSAYKIVILENDVLLQQLDGETTVDSRLLLESRSPLALSLPAPSDGKEYRLKVGPQQSRFAFQIAQAPEGMAIRYEFAAEEMSLAAMALDLGDEEDEGMDFSIGSAAMPTVVTEVDITEKTILVEQRGGFLGLGGFAGSMIPIAGGGTGLVAGAEITAALPWLDRAIALSVRGAFMRHELAASVSDPMGGAIDAHTTIYAVPVIGKISGRLRLGDLFALMMYGGFGVSHVRAERAALDATKASAEWLWTACGGLGFELALGPGSLLVDAGYLHAPPADFGASLQGYTPAGPVFTAGYRMGL